MMIRSVMPGKPVQPTSRKPTGNQPVSSSKSASSTPDAADSKDAKLHKSAKDMEGVFIQQMYKSMRSTVPSDGAFDGGSGEDMFTGLMDEHVAADTPAQWPHGLSEAIYHQLKAADAAHNPQSPPSAVPSPSYAPDPA